MQSAAPLVRAGLLTAADGRRLSLPPRPPSVDSHSVCALSGMPASAACPYRKLEYFDRARRPPGVCTWHQHDADGRLRLSLPEPVQRWSEQRLRRGGVVL